MRVKSSLALQTSDGSSSDDRHSNEGDFAPVITAAEDRPSASAAIAPIGAYAWYASAVLSLAFMFGVVDRMILNLLVEPVRHDLHISDTQISLLQGFAYTIANGLAGIPIAWAADRYSRRTIAAIGTIFWSVMTIFCCLASNFNHLFLARFGLGIGESALAPASYSMLSDMFPREKLSQALGINMVGGTLGVGLAAVAGGPLVLALETIGPVTVPLIGTLKSWQLAFPIVGLPALFVGLWIWSLREPPRRRPAASTKPAIASWAEVFAFVGEQRRVMIAIFAGFSMLILVSQAITAWFPTFMVRQFGWDIGRVGIAVGLILGGVGTATALAGGRLVERVQRRGYTDATLRIGGISAVILGICGVCSPLASSAALALALFAPAVVAIVLGVVQASTTVQLVTPSNMRARVTALYLFWSQLVSGGLGPLIVALLTDHVFHDPAAIGYSLAIVSAVFGPLAAITIVSGMSAFRRQLARIDEAAAGAFPQMQAST